ncbi:MAG: two-component system, response regulator, stage 0 sporulation protein [Clostridia bacterium]|nr:two-component system, response regulator, stage 0 sporulation protein [Clostridia bacterium]
MKIALVIDDQPAIRRLLAEILRQAGFRVITAGEGRDALEKMAEWEIDLIILDMKMPGMSGAELLRQIRRKSQNPEIIVITAYSESEVTDQAMKLGVRHILQKPFDVGLLRSIIKRIA